MYTLSSRCLAVEPWSLCVAQPIAVAAGEPKQRCVDYAIARGMREEITGDGEGFALSDEMNAFGVPMRGLGNVLCRGTNYAWIISMT